MGTDTPSDVPALPPEPLRRCAHNYPVNSSCPHCKLEAHAQKADRLARLVWAVLGIPAADIGDLDVVPFHKASQHLRDLCNLGGDEDWIITGSDKDRVEQLAAALCVCSWEIRDKLADGQWVAVTCHA